MSFNCGLSNAKVNWHWHPLIAVVYEKYGISLMTSYLGHGCKCDNVAAAFNVSANFATIGCD